MVRNRLKALHKISSKTSCILCLLLVFLNCSFSKTPELKGMLSLLTSTSNSLYSIGGTVTGLSGTGLVIQNNTTDNLTISTNGTFTFTSLMASNNNYSITVLTNPTSPTQYCSISNGTGTVISANITNIIISCTDFSISYSGSPFTFTQGSVITTITPTVIGTVTGCSASPSLPSGLNINPTTCVITGTPTTVQSPTSYTITATNSSGSTTATIDIAIIIPTPSTLTFTGSPFTFTQGSVITTITPTVIGTVTGCSASPSLPSGLNIDSTTCVITGTPTMTQASTSHIITPANTSGNGATATINITVNAPANYYIVRTSISGLMGSITLQNNLTESLTLSANGNSFFPTALVNGTSYSVSIQTYTSGQVCSISNLPYGTLSGADVTVNILCVVGYLFNGVLLATASPPTLNQSFLGLTTIAGNYPTVTSGSANGVGTAASFNNPIAITSDGANIYVADLSNNLIRKVSIGTNTVSTLASGITQPHGVATDGVNVYVSSYGSNRIYKTEIATGTVTLLAGTGVAGDAIGVGTSAQFNEPTYLTTDGTNLYVTDRANSKIKQIILNTGIVSTLVTGLSSPNGIATDGTNLYIAETGAHRIRKFVLATTTLSIVAGTGASGNVNNADGLLAQFNNPYGVTMDGTYLYILEGDGKNLKKMQTASPNGVTTIMAQNNGYLDGTIGTAQFCAGGANCDSSITFDGTYLYIADRFNNSIRKLYY